jgi:hypothetical protein
MNGPWLHRVNRVTHRIAAVRLDAAVMLVVIVSVVTTDLAAMAIAADLPEGGQDADGQ